MPSSGDGMNLKALRAVLFFLSVVSPLAARAQTDVSLWLTNPDRSALFQLQTPPLPLASATATNQVINVDAAKAYQTIDGFGFALTGGSAQLIMRMEPAKRAALLQELFGVDGNNIGISYLRLTVGASDMNDHVFSYDDLPEGQTDPDMAKFSLDPDKADVIPVMKEILAINPKIKILASPWTAPAWMKDNDDVKGGHLKKEFYAAYANYWVKYL